MVLKNIELKNFRLHKHSFINFSDELNYIIGGNGQGKTTILEAIYYLCTTKSLNQTTDLDVVNFNEEFFEVKGVFQNRTKNSMKINYAQNKKSVFLNDKQVHKTSSIIGKFPVVVLTQSDHAITQGSPGERRKFVDSVISQASETYLSILLDYNKTLRHRSSLLTGLKENRSGVLLDQLEAWTESLLKQGTELVKHRVKFVNEFREYLSSAFQNMMGSRETPEINYKFLNTTDFDESEIESLFKQELDNRRNDELRRATNLVGPHRDDFLFNVNDYELRKYGSQGQHKTFLIALRFAEFFYLNDKLGNKPIFLMDDIFGELDTFRATKISEYLKEVGQAFITMTDFSNAEFLEREDTDLVVNVKNGEIANA
jgi:DNA replication and repair protein RecF